MDTKRSYAEQLRQADQQKVTDHKSAVKQQPDVNHQSDDKQLRYTDQLRQADQQVKRHAK